jgi:hypothetical protein
LELLLSFCKFRGNPNMAGNVLLKLSVWLGQTATATTAADQINRAWHQAKTSSQGCWAAATQ